MANNIKEQKKADYLVVGAGLFGAVFAHEAAKAGKWVHVIDRRHHLGGNIYTEKIAGIDVHKYGAHIFHTSNHKIWTYIQQFATFNQFINTPIANYQGRLYNLPFNMNTFYQLWGVHTPEEAKKKIQSQTNRQAHQRPRNLEEQAISLVGTDIYTLLIKGYTEKQWGKPCIELPSFIIKRLPIRFTYDNNYFNDRYQGIPVGGYTQIVEKMLDHPQITVSLNTDFFDNQKELSRSVKKTIYTGPIDQYFSYCFGPLAYRSLRFETEILTQDNFQGVAVMNFTEKEVPYTRIIEHKHFTFGKQKKTVITKEFPMQWTSGKEPYYPINDSANHELYRKYKTLAEQLPDVRFGGRLGSYRYYDMHEVIAEALKLAEKELGIRI